MVPLLLYLTGKYLYKKYRSSQMPYVNKKKSIICFYYKHEIFRNTTQLNTTQLIFFIQSICPSVWEYKVVSGGIFG